MKLNEIFLNEFKDEMAVTINFLEVTSEDFFEFKPHEKARKLNDLLNHVLPIPSWINLHSLHSGYTHSSQKN